MTAQRGGYVIYCGPLGTNSQCLVDYFEVRVCVRFGAHPDEALVVYAAAVSARRIHIVTVLECMK